MTKLKKLIIPNNLQVDMDTLTSNYGKFVAEPFEAGYGNTIGNSLRRILLSSMEGNAITAIKIKGVTHEYSVIPGVLQDVMQLILNLKLVRFKTDLEEVQRLRLYKKGEGEILAGDIETNSNIEVVNKDLVIANLDIRGELDMELYVGKGRGYLPVEEQDKSKISTNTIAIDAIFSPIVRVNYEVENVRVEHITDFDKLIIEIWTDGTIKPEDALSYSAKILKDSMNIFINNSDNKQFLIGYKKVNKETNENKTNDKSETIKNFLTQTVDIIELSVRSANCLKSAKIRTIKELVSKKEVELLTYKNFGRKSLDEIREKLQQMGLNLGMDLHTY
ncbi:MAG: DNA-directed RNA polymerase subunit alpha [Elusimicrobiota bacterium]|jgi:DNA-directed RNA polymerase subunit alpha|nr:DNA-directed RNA polymerase subunit alpha [Elusimicrobiota bacterium]